MKIQIVHFDPVTGAVFQLGMNDAPFDIAGLRCCEFRNVSYYDVQFTVGLTVDLASLVQQEDGTWLGDIVSPATVH